VHNLRLANHRLGRQLRSKLKRSGPITADGKRMLWGVLFVVAVQSSYSRVLARPGRRQRGDRGECNSTVLDEVRKQTATDCRCVHVLDRTTALLEQPFRKCLESRRSHLPCHWDVRSRFLDPHAQATLTNRVLRVGCVLCITALTNCIAHYHGTRRSA
jgi:hypothetical protein